MMRKILTALSVAAITAAALATPAAALPDDRYPMTTSGAALGTGAVVGTVAGVGLYNAWWGTSAAGFALPASAAASAAVGGVAGVGAVALVDSAIQPCRGFQALLGVNHGACADGEYVGYAPARRVR